MRPGIKSEDVKWNLVGASFLKAVWDMVGDKLVEILESTISYRAVNHAIPVVRAGQLHIVKGPELKDCRVIPLHQDGWREFIELAEKSAIKRAELTKAGQFWWDNCLPPGFRPDSM